jgi:hypothetical protein
LASTGLVHGLTLVTRNTVGVERTGVPWLNSFTKRSASGSRHAIDAPVTPLTARHARQAHISGIGNPPDSSPEKVTMTTSTIQALPRRTLQNRVLATLAVPLLLLVPLLALRAFEAAESSHGDRVGSSERPKSQTIAVSHESSVSKRYNRGSSARVDERLAAASAVQSAIPLTAKTAAHVRGRGNHLRR